MPLPAHTHTTRKAAANEVKARLFVGPSHKGPIPEHLFIIKDFRPGKRPVWRVTELSPGFNERWYGPFTRTTRRHELEDLGATFIPIYPDWVGRPI